MKIKKENLYIGLSMILGVAFPFVWLLTIALLNDLKNEKGIKISFLKINIIMFSSAILFGLSPILLALLQLFSLNFLNYPRPGIPFHVFIWFTIPLAFAAYVVSFLGYNICIWRKLNREDVDV